VTSEFLAQNVAFLASKVGADSARRFAARLAPLGLNPREFALLHHIGSAQGRSQQALSELLEVPASRMVALVDGLERRGLVERRRNPTDRRRSALHLTPEGRAALAAAIERAAEHEAELCAGLAPAEQRQLVALLRRLAARQDLPLGVHPGLKA
jgi:DNA-binding MarR family transcriptional regulator